MNKMTLEVIWREMSGLRVLWSGIQIRKLAAETWVSTLNISYECHWNLEILKDEVRCHPRN